MRLAAAAAAITAAVAMRLAACRALWAFDVAFWLLFEFAVGDFDFAFFVQADDDDFERIADFDDLGGVFDVVPGKPGDVAEAIDVAEEIDECAIILDAGDFAFEHFADLGFAGDLVDHGLGLLDDLAIMVIDGDDAGFGNVDRDVVAFLDDALDGFATFADDIADLGGVNLEGDHLRRVFGDFFPWLRDASGDGFADLCASALCLLESFVENFAGDAMDLDVHLKRGEALLGACALEVHVAEVIFETLDIGEDGRCL